MSRRLLGIGVRRGIRTGSGASSTPIADLVAAIISGYGTQSQRAWLRADSYSMDGVSGKVGSFVDLLDPTHLLTQTQETRQIAAPSADAALNGAVSGTLSAHWYDSNRAPSSWGVYHNGGGCTVINVFVPTTFATSNSVMVATCAGTGGAGDVGFEMRRTSAATRVLVRNGASALVNISGGTMVDGTGYWSAYQLLSGRSPDDATLTLKGTQVAQGDASSTLPTGEPTASLRLGALTGGSAPYLGRWAESMLIPGIPTTDEMATIHAYFLARYGLAA